MTNLDILTFTGREANVNAYIVLNSSHAVVIDTLRNREEAAELAAIVRQTRRTLETILVTHGHPDHYIGLRTLKEAFPSARIVVASDAVKHDIMEFSTWMDGIGWLDQQPQMKPRNAQTPDGFDYQSAIEVLGGKTLELTGGGEIQLRTDYPSVECAHMTTAFVPELNALFASDLCYHGVHAWAGPSVMREHLANWIGVLGELKSQFSGTGVRVYPGHGKASDASLFDAMRIYLSDFIGAVDAEPTNAAAIERMKRLYPGFAQDDFLLLHSVNFHGPDKRQH
jgi:glyoxylase-like metal-dependent hydrolase (beta-lactamase superfamily II)